MDTGHNVFVIMPFSDTSTCTAGQWTEIFENVFRPAIEECGYTCERATLETGSIIKTIVDRLRNSRIVLADITDRNPNVFYELGVRHSLSKRTISITQDSSHVPSDLRGYWFISYGTSPGMVTQFKKEIRKLITEIENDPEKSDNPVSDYLEKENSTISNYVNIENMKKLSALYTEFTGNIIELTHMLHNPRVPLLSYDCLKLLLQTMYIDLGTELLKSGYELYNKLRMIERGEDNQELLEDSINDIRKLSVEILMIRNKLARGQYLEPENISLMVWEPASTKFNVMRGASECKGCSGTGKCSKCNGKGGSLDTIGATKCPKCNGSGNCTVCRGKGRT